MKRFLGCCLLLLVAGAASNLHSGNDSVDLRRLSGEEGLSKSVSTSLLQDDQGFMWIGTYDGLNRYDGYQFKVYRPDPEDTTSLSNNYVRCLLQDRRRFLWIGTKKGLNRYDPAKDAFQPVRLAANRRDFEITALCEDADGRLWIGTPSGLCVLDSILRPGWPLRTPETSRGISSIFSSPDGRILVGTESRFLAVDPLKLRILPVSFEGLNADVRVYCMVRTSDGTQWVGSDRGLWILHAAVGYCVRPRQPSLRQSVLLEAAIYSMQIDDFGNLWFGTWGEGVFRFNSRTGVLDGILNAQASQSLDHVHQIFHDRSGMVWISSKTGIYLYDTYARPFEAHPLRDRGDGLMDWQVSKIIVQDPFLKDVLWMSTDSGLLRYDMSTGDSRWISHIPGFQNRPIHSLFMEPSGLLWLGTTSELISYDTRRNIWTYHPEIRHPNPSVSRMSLYSLLRDDRGVLWVGTYENGLFRLDLQTRRVRLFVHDPKDSASLPDNHVWALFEDRQKRLWIGTDRGFALMDRGKGTFKSWNADEPKSFPLISNQVRVIAQDRENRLWIGTDGGLCRFDPTTSRMECFSEKDGLPNHVIHGILEETHPSGVVCPIWFSTNRGLLRFDPASGKWTSFLKQDGLNDAEFSRQCFCKLRDGRLVFGGFNGFTVCDPDRFVLNPHPPEVVYTDFQLFYQSVDVSRPFLGKIVLKQSVSRSQRIVLSPKHETFSFEFAAPHFQQPDRLRYWYRLDGFNSDWIDAKGMRVATYTNLKPGEYALRVRADSPDGVPSRRDAVMRITMTPSFWQRWPVRISALLLALGGLAAVSRIRTRSIRNRNLLLKRFNARLKQQIDEKTEAERSLRESQGLLKASLDEKEILIRELYHRTKNNMQVISSMLHIHSRSVDNPQMKNFLKEIINKIMAMSLVHQRLYESEDLSHLNLKEYFIGLVSLIQKSYIVDPARITMTVEGDDTRVLIDTAIPCGLVINELITNSIKHAFPGRERGNIRISAFLNPKRELVIEASDDGVGLPEGFDVKKDARLGMKTVIDLIEYQLQGKISFAVREGLACRIELREEFYKPRI